MLNVVHGEVDRRADAQRLIEGLMQLDIEGTLYFGYPVLATIQGTIKVDATLVSRQHGVVVFTFKRDLQLDNESLSIRQMLDDEQDQLFVSIESKLMDHAFLREGRRKLAFEITTITIVPDLSDGLVGDGEHHYCEMGNVIETIVETETIDDALLLKIQSALEHVTTIKPRKAPDWFN